MPRLLAAYLLPLIIAMAIPGLAYVHFETGKSTEQALADLSSVAKLKAELISSWLAERKGDADTLQGSLNFSLRVEQFIRQGRNSTDGAILASRLESLRNSYGYDSVLLLDAAGDVSLGFGNNLDVSKAVADLLPSVRAEARPRHTE